MTQDQSNESSQPQELQELQELGDSLVLLMAALVSTTVALVKVGNRYVVPVATRVARLTAYKAMQNKGIASAVANCQSSWQEAANQVHVLKAQLVEKAGSAHETKEALTALITSSVAGFLAEPADQKQTQQQAEDSTQDNQQLNEAVDCHTVGVSTDIVHEVKDNNHEIKPSYSRSVGVKTSRVQNTSKGFSLNKGQEDR